VLTHAVAVQSVLGCLARFCGGRSR
jgi:hypothetical protein